MNRNKVAPEVTMINGVPHMLAYVNRAEKDMLRKAGGTGLAGPDGVPAYGFWDNFTSAVSNAASGFADAITSAPSNIARDLGNMAKQVNNDFGLINNVAKNLTSSSNNNSSNNSSNLKNANAAAAASMLDAGVLNVGGKQKPTEPSNAGNPPILKYDGGSGNYSVVGALDPNKPASTSTNEDGSQYNPNNNPAQAEYTDNVADLIKKQQEEAAAAEQAAAQAAAQEAANQAAAAEAKRQAELAAALGDRDAALASQMSSLSDAFGFGTDDYYSGLSDSYTADNNQAFQTAYDDAMRGIYDGFKSAGILTQSGVDQDKSKLGSANLSETNKLGTAAEEYAKANRSFVDEGRTGIEGQLQGLAVNADTADAYRAQTESIKGFDVAGASKPFQTATERSVADFFSDFAKRSYDPSYNVAPTAVASAGPSRVTQSVNQFGPNTQASSQVGIRSPYKGRSTRVVT